VAAFLRCGDLQEGFARVRCPDCQHEMFVAFSCKQRCTCPSCHQKRTLLTAMHVAEDVCLPVAHRQVVLTIPRRLRLHTWFDRKLLNFKRFTGLGSARPRWSFFDEKPPNRTPPTVWWNKSKAGQKPGARLTHICRWVFTAFQAVHHWQSCLKSTAGKIRYNRTG